MPDASLHGNGDDCPACALRRDELRAAGAMDQTVDCNLCGGLGRIPRDPGEIVRLSAEWARRHYWPAREAAWRAENEARAKAAG